MKTMTLTALATEQSFDNGGKARFYLVFNEGELRVEISQEAAETVVQAMCVNEPATTEANEATDYPQSGNESYGYDDGVDQV